MTDKKKYNKIMAMIDVFETQHKHMGFITQYLEMFIRVSKIHR